MKTLLFGFILATGVISCDNAGADIVPLQGTYIGYFHRIGNDTARVTLRFTDNQFQGFSNKTTYPAIRSGSFRQSSNTISFLDSTTASSQAGAPIVLEGEFNYAFNDDGTVRIWKKVGDAEDEFILKASANDMVLNSGTSPPFSNSNSLE